VPSRPGSHTGDNLVVVDGSVVAAQTSARVEDREWAQEYGVDDAEHCRVHADAESQYQTLRSPVNPDCGAAS